MRDMLAKQLWLNDRLPVSDPRPETIAGDCCMRLEPKPTGGPARPVVDIYEVFWSDKIGAEAEQPPPQRFWNATKLLGYWVLNLWWLRALTRSATMTFGLTLSGILIAAWYVTVIVAVAALVVDNAGAPPDQAASGGISGLFYMGSDALAPVLQKIAPFAKNQYFVAAMLLMPLLKINEMVAVATFARRYLMTGGDGGLHDELRGRTQRTLENISALRAEDDPGQPAYDEVVLLGHSLGGAIALEALAHWGDTPLRGRTVLVTWGSPLAVLACRSPERVRKAIQVACTDTLPGWIDVFSPSDWMSMRLAEHDEAYPGATLERKFPVAWWQGVSKAAHMQYFYDAEVTTMLLAPRVAVDTAVPGPDVD